ncbi:MAG: hypothetical protein IJA77_07605 [Clostridia bacterium]|nr:hypothetical protein [Clostridia bacterium]
MISFDEVSFGYQELIGNVYLEHNWIKSGDHFGGVDVLISFRNTSDKTIKYVTFNIQPLNAVGDVVTCRISGRSDVRLRYTGPLAPGAQCFQAVWGKEWYNSTIQKLGFGDIEIEYMDGTTEVQRELIWTPKKGCYVATCVYGSYDCPQVWTLRRFRDHQLASNLPGRLFIKAYYATSPTLVKWFGKTAWFKKLWKSALDRLVHHLNKEGVKDTPYQDKGW